MKSLFNNRRRVTIYGLLALSAIAFFAQLLLALFLYGTSSPLGLGIAFIGIIFFGSLAFELRIGSPW